MIKIRAFAVNPFREVTYVVGGGDGKCIIIDCGAQEAFERERIEEYIAREGWQPVLLANTHGHVDHILGVNYFKEKYGIPFAADSREQPVLDAGETSAALFGLTAEKGFVPSIDIDLKGMEELTFGATALRIVPTPGHTPGGVSFHDAEGGNLFTGDTLFSGSIGRTDLPGGDYPQLMESILKRILPLGGGTVIYPGHGNHSTLAQEAAYNPFITEVLRGEVHV